MLDIKYIVENAEHVKERLGIRGKEFDIDSVIADHNQRRQLVRDVEQLKAVRNTVSDQIASLKRNGKPAEEKIAQMKQLGERIKELDERLSVIENGLKEALSFIPNLPDESVPSGLDEKSNVEIKKIGEIPQFDFVPKPHWELGESLDIIDSTRAAKISGARFVVLKNDGARLERALMNFMLDTHIQNGYKEIFPPFMVNEASMYGTGQLPKFKEDAFFVDGTNYYLIPTAEVPVTNLFRNEVIDSSLLPLNFCAYTSCFRAEAGSAGRDTRGLIRQHQFQKVELVKFVRKEDSFKELEKITADAERLLRLLGLPYRVVCLCGGDLGFSSAKTYDIEVWMPSYNKYVEISSCSNFCAFQARRMNIKYKELNDGEYIHTLNGSGLPLGRTAAAIMENFQNKDGTISIPKVLTPYFKKDIIG